MRNTYRRLLSVLLFTGAIAVAVGCGDSGGIAPAPAGDGTIKLKPLPTPGSPADEGKQNKKAAGAGPKSE